MVVCLERGAADAAVSCFSKIQVVFTFLVPAHPGSPRQRAVKRVCVCVCVFVCLFVCFQDNLGKPVPDSGFNSGKSWWGFGMPWHQLDHMQTICTSLQMDNHTNTSSLNFYRLEAFPDAQLTVSKHWRHYNVVSVSIHFLSDSPDLHHWPSYRQASRHWLAYCMDWWLVILLCMYSSNCWLPDFCLHSLC